MFGIALGKRFFVIIFLLAVHHAESWRLGTFSLDDEDIIPSNAESSAEGSSGSGDLESWRLGTFSLDDEDITPSNADRSAEGSSGSGDLRAFSSASMDNDILSDDPDHIYVDYIVHDNNGGSGSNIEDFDVDQRGLSLNRPNVSSAYAYSGEEPVGSGEWRNDIQLEDNIKPSLELCEVKHCPRSCPSNQSVEAGTVLGMNNIIHLKVSSETKSTGKLLGIENLGLSCDSASTSVGLRLIESGCQVQSGLMVEANLGSISCLSLQIPESLPCSHIYLHVEVTSCSVADVEMCVQDPTVLRCSDSASRRIKRSLPQGKTVVGPYLIQYEKAAAGDAVKTLEVQSNIRYRRPVHDHHIAGAH